VGKSVVVGAAVLRQDRLLACRRTTPPAAAGRWELPGGKVEPGETPDAALVREVAEELGVDVVVAGWLDGSSPIADTHELRVATCTVAGWAPYPLEHDRLRWLRADELDDVDWLEPDRPFLDQLRGRLR
jgi:8-oxo-dGTP diphosphatase